MVLSSSWALASETSQIKVSVADLHVKPAQESRTALRLGLGHEVEVVATSDDGRWVQVKGQLPFYDEKIAFAGWIDASAIGAAVKSQRAAEVAPVDAATPAATPAATSAATPAAKRATAEYHLPW